MYYQCPCLHNIIFKQTFFSLCFDVGGFPFSRSAPVYTLKQFLEDTLLLLNVSLTSAQNHIILWNDDCLSLTRSISVQRDGGGGQPEVDVSRMGFSNIAN